MPPNPVATVGTNSCYSDGSQQMMGIVMTNQPFQMPQYMMSTDETPAPLPPPPPPPPPETNGTFFDAPLTSLLLLEQSQPAATAGGGNASLGRLRII